MSVLSNQRDYLEQVAWSKEAIDTVEREMKADRLAYRIFIGIACGLFLVNVANAIVAFGVVRLDLATELILFVPLYIFSTVFVVAFLLSCPEYRAFKTLVKSMDTVDAAMGVKPAIGPRRRLAARVSYSASKIRACGSWMPWGLPWGLDKRILKQQATRACQALRQFVYPALLGTDDELRQVKEAIARAVIRVGTRNWVQVVDLAPDPVPVPKHIRTGLTPEGVVSFLVVVIPLITALVTALTKI